MATCARASADDGKSRRPVPDAAAQQKATSLIKDIFKDDFDAAKTSAKKLELAKKLIQQAEESQNEPASQYVLLTEGRDLAVAAGEMPLALLAIDKTAEVFKIDSAAVKLEALNALNKSATAAQAKPLADEALAEVSAGLERRRFCHCQTALHAGRRRGAEGQGC